MLQTSIPHFEEVLGSQALSEDMDAAVSVLLEHETEVPISEIWYFDGSPFEEARMSKYGVPYNNRLLNVAVILDSDDSKYSAFTRVPDGDMMDEEGDFRTAYGETLERKALRWLVERNPNLHLSDVIQLHILTQTDCENIKTGNILRNKPDLVREYATEGLRRLLIAIKEGYLLYQADI